MKEDSTEKNDDTDEIKELTEELEKEKEKYLRLAAEFDNFRKRCQKEQEEFRKYSNEKLIVDLLDIYEGLERGIENFKKTDDKEKIIKGLEILYNQFDNVLKSYGLSPIKSIGEKFDPYKHEAMMQTETDEYEDGTIIEEFKKGYTLNNKVICYSKVRVSKRKNNEVK